MLRKHRPLDEIDMKILDMLQKNCKTTVEQIAKNLGASKSKVHYRIKKLEAEKIIEGYYAKVDSTKLGKDFITITFVRTKYGPRYHEKVGNLLAQIPGVWAIYFVYGEIDFIVLSRSYNNTLYMKKLEKIMALQEIESTSTQIVAKIIKEDPRIDFESST